MNDTTWTKRTCDVIKLSKLEEGAEVVGRYSHQRERELTDKATGLVKMVPEFVLLADNGDKFSFLGDSGFVSEFHNADIKENELMKIIKGPQVDIGGGKRVNQYEIYTA